MSDILFKKDIADTLDYDRADKTLSARQGLALKNMMAKLRKTMLLETHPVGSLYWSMNATNPADLFGGTWEQIKDRFIWATTSNPGGTGGAYNRTLSTANLPSHTHSIPSHTHTYTKATAVQSHTLTANEMPSHNHTEYIGMQYGSTKPSTNTAEVLLGYWNWTAQTPSGTGMVSNYTGVTSKTGGGASHSHGLSTSSQNTGSTGGTSGATGSGTAFSIIPPYLEAYCWKRTA